MKKLLVILLLLVGTFSFSQEKKTEIPLDERINKSLDSLSKIYNKKVFAFGSETYRGVKKTYILYVENGKEIEKVTKIEIVGTPKKEE
jgi:hypothetical protein